MTKKLLLIFIGLNSIIQIGLFIMLLADSQLALNYLKVQGCDGMLIFEAYFIAAIIIIAPLGFLAMRWLGQNKNEGLTLARYLGITMTIAAIYVGASLHRADLACMDLARGIPITLLAFLLKPFETKSI